ncbi:MAG: hypothetical protein AMXMBFR48_02700 [Ignavibacteriales bacterium]
MPFEINKLDQSDSIKRFVEKDSDEELSPMSPPDAYAPPALEDMNVDEMDEVLRRFIEEHNNCLKKVDSFEQALNRIREEGFGAHKEVSNALSDFFEFVDTNITKHNIKEEKILFPLLQERYFETGEHSQGSVQKTAVDMLEDDHVKFMQLAGITFTLLGLAGRLPDQSSRLVVLDFALEQGKMLAEMLRLHIFREDKIVFPFAQKNLSPEEFSKIKTRMDEFEKRG